MNSAPSSLHNSPPVSPLPSFFSAFIHPSFFPLSSPVLPVFRHFLRKHLHPTAFVTLLDQQLRSPSFVIFLGNTYTPRLSSLPFGISIMSICLHRSLSFTIPFQPPKSANPRPRHYSLNPSSVFCPHYNSQNTSLRSTISNPPKRPCFNTPSSFPPQMTLSADRRLKTLHCGSALKVHLVLGGP